MDAAEFRRFEEEAADFARLNKKLKETLFVLLKKGLRKLLSKEEIEEVLKDFDNSFTHLQLTIRKHWETNLKG